MTNKCFGCRGINPGSAEPRYTLLCKQVEPNQLPFEEKPSDLDLHCFSLSM